MKSSVGVDYSNNWERVMDRLFNLLLLFYVQAENFHWYGIWQNSKLKGMLVQNCYNGYC